MNKPPSKLRLIGCDRACHLHFEQWFLCEFQMRHLHCKALATSYIRAFQYTTPTFIKLCRYKNLSDSLQSGMKDYRKVDDKRASIY